MVACRHYLFLQKPILMKAWCVSDVDVHRHAYREQQGGCFKRLRAPSKTRCAAERARTGDLPETRCRRAKRPVEAA